jgi:hypothetical protein
MIINNIIKNKNDRANATNIAINKLPQDVCMHCENVGLIIVSFNIVPPLPAGLVQQDPTDN